MGSRENRRKKSQIAEENFKSAEKKKSGNRLMWIGSLILLILIVVTFVGAPVVTKLGKSNRIIFGTYNGRPIEYRSGNYFSRQRDYIADQLEKSGQNSNMDWQIFQVWKEAYDRTVIHTALLDMAKSSGMILSNDRLDRYIVEEGPYTVDGEFNERLYTSSTNAEKQATRDFMLENVLAGQVQQDILMPYISTAEREFVRSMASVERAFRFITYSFDEYPDESVVSFAEENSGLFRSMELSRITIKSGEKDAKTIHDRLSADPTLFEELARTQSKDSFADKGGAMGTLSFYSATSFFKNDEDTEYVFSLSEGDISRVIEVPSGWAIYRCDAGVVLPDLSSMEEIDAVRTYMIRFERGTIEDYLINQAEGFIEEAGNAGFESAALIRGKIYKTTDYFPVNYGEVSMVFYGTPYSVFPGITVNGTQSQDLLGASTNIHFLSGIHSLDEKEISEPYVLGDKVIVMQCTDVRDVPEEESEMITMIYPMAAQYWYNQDLSTIVMSSDKFEDNFTSEFTRLFLSQDQ